MRIRSLRHWPHRIVHRTSWHECSAIPANTRPFLSIHKKNVWSEYRKGHQLHTSRLEAKESAEMLQERQDLVMTLVHDYRARVKIYTWRIGSVWAKHRRVMCMSRWQVLVTANKLANKRSPTGWLAPANKVRLWLMLICATTSSNCSFTQQRNRCYQHHCSASPEMHRTGFPLQVSWTPPTPWQAIARCCLTDRLSKHVIFEYPLHLLHSENGQMKRQRAHGVGNTVWMLPFHLSTHTLDMAYGMLGAIKVQSWVRMDGRLERITFIER